MRNPRDTSPGTLVAALCCWLSLCAAPAHADLLEKLSASVEVLTDQVNPAVVQLVVSGYRIAPSRNQASQIVTRIQGSGSGVLLAPDGYIVTNLHVINNAERVQVALTGLEVQGRSSILAPEAELLDAEIVGTDRETDLAVIKIERSGLPFLELGDSDELRLGELVFAFGSPLGLENSVSMGVVSAVARQLKQDAPMIYVQTDAAINPGNSGGPLVNREGRVVGINTLILSKSGGSEGIGLAAPSNIVKTVYERIRRDGRVRRGAIAADTLTITPRLAQALNLRRLSGVLIEDAFPGGPAYKAGLRPGDIVLALDGKSVENARQFDVNVYLKPIGSSVTMTVDRDGKPQELEMPVIERADPGSRFRQITVEKRLLEDLDIVGADLGPDLRELLGATRRDKGVVVIATTPGAAQETFRTGDLIYSVNDRTVRNTAGLLGVLGVIDEASPLVVQIEREGRLRYVQVR